MKTKGKSADQDKPKKKVVVRCCPCSLNSRCTRCVCVDLGGCRPCCISHRCSYKTVPTGQVQADDNSQDADSSEESDGDKDDVNSESGPEMKQHPGEISEEEEPSVNEEPHEEEPSGGDVLDKAEPSGGEVPEVEEPSGGYVSQEKVPSGAEVPEEEAPSGGDVSQKGEHSGGEENQCAVSLAVNTDSLLSGTASSLKSEDTSVGVRAETCHEKNIVGDGLKAESNGKFKTETFKTLQKPESDLCSLTIDDGLKSIDEDLGVTKENVEVMDMVETEVSGSLDVHGNSKSGGDSVPASHYSDKSVTETGLKLETTVTPELPQLVDSESCCEEANSVLENEVQVKTVTSAEAMGTPDIEHSCEDSAALAETAKKSSTENNLIGKTIASTDSQQMSNVDRTDEADGLMVQDALEKSEEEKACETSSFVCSVTSGKTIPNDDKTVEIDMRNVSCDSAESSQYAKPSSLLPLISLKLVDKNKESLEHKAVQNDISDATQKEVVRESKCDDNVLQKLPAKSGAVAQNMAPQKPEVKLKKSTAKSEAKYSTEPKEKVGLESAPKTVKEGTATSSKVLEKPVKCVLKEDVRETKSNVLSKPDYLQAFGRYDIHKNSSYEPPPFTSQDCRDFIEGKMTPGVHNLIDRKFTPDAMDFDGGAFNPSTLGCIDDLIVDSASRTLQIGPIYIKDLNNVDLFKCLNTAKQYTMNVFNAKHSNISTKTDAGYPREEGKAAASVNDRSNQISMPTVSDNKPQPQEAASDMSADGCTTEAAEHMDRNEENMDGKESDHDMGKKIASGEKLEESKATSVALEEVASSAVQKGLTRDKVEKQEESVQTEAKVPAGVDDEVQMDTGPGVRPVATRLLPAETVESDSESSDSEGWFSEEEGDFHKVTRKASMTLRSQDYADEEADEKTARRSIIVRDLPPKFIDKGRKFVKKELHNGYKMFGVITRIELNEEACSPYAIITFSQSQSVEWALRHQNNTSVYEQMIEVIPYEDDGEPLCGELPKPHRTVMAIRYPQYWSSLSRPAFDELHSLFTAFETTVDTEDGNESLEVLETVRRAWMQDKRHHKGAVPVAMKGRAVKKNPIMFLRPKIPTVYFSFTKEMRCPVCPTPVFLEKASFRKHWAVRHLMKRERTVCKICGDIVTNTWEAREEHQHDGMPAEYEQRLVDNEHYIDPKRYHFTMTITGGFDTGYIRQKPGHKRSYRVGSKVKHLSYRDLMKWCSSIKQTDSHLVFTPSEPDKLWCEANEPVIRCLMFTGLDQSVTGTKLKGLIDQFGEVEILMDNVKRRALVHFSTEDSAEACMDRFRRKEFVRKVMLEYCSLTSEMAFLRDLVKTGQKQLCDLPELLPFGDDPRYGYIDAEFFTKKDMITCSQLLKSYNMKSRFVIPQHAVLRDVELKSLEYAAYEAHSSERDIVIPGDTSNIMVIPGIPLDLTGEELKAKIPDAKSVLIPRTPDGTSKGYAYVEVSDAKKAAGREVFLVDSPAEDHQPFKMLELARGRKPVVGAKSAARSTKKQLIPSHLTSQKLTKSEKQLSTVRKEVQSNSQKQKPNHRELKLIWEVGQTKEYHYEYETLSRDWEVSSAQSQLAGNVSEMASPGDAVSENDESDDELLQPIQVFHKQPVKGKKRKAPAKGVRRGVADNLRSMGWKTQQGPRASHQRIRNHEALKSQQIRGKMSWKVGQKVSKFGGQARQNMTKKMALLGDWPVGHPHYERTKRVKKGMYLTGRLPSFKPGLLGERPGEYPSAAVPYPWEASPHGQIHPSTYPIPSVDPGFDQSQPMIQDQELTYPHHHIQAAQSLYPSQQVQNPYVQPVQQIDPYDQYVQGHPVPGYPHNPVPPHAEYQHWVSSIVPPQSTAPEQKPIATNAALLAGQSAAPVSSLVAIGDHSEAQEPDEAYKKWLTSCSSQDEPALDGQQSALASGPGHQHASQVMPAHKKQSKNTKSQSPVLHRGRGPSRVDNRDESPSPGCDGDDIPLFHIRDSLSRQEDPSEHVSRQDLHFRSQSSRKDDQTKREDKYSQGHSPEDRRRQGDSRKSSDTSHRRLGKRTRDHSPQHDRYRDRRSPHHDRRSRDRSPRHGKHSRDRSPNGDRQGHKRDRSSSHSHRRPSPKRSKNSHHAEERHHRGSPDRRGHTDQGHSGSSHTQRSPEKKSKSVADHMAAANVLLGMVNLLTSKMHGRSSQKSGSASTGSHPSQSKEKSSASLASADSKSSRSHYTANQPSRNEDRSPHSANSHQRQSSLPLTSMKRSSDVHYSQGSDCQPSQQSQEHVSPHGNSYFQKEEMMPLPGPAITVVRKPAVQPGQGREGHSSQHLKAPSEKEDELDPYSNYYFPQVDASGSSGHHSVESELGCGTCGTPFKTWKALQRHRRYVCGPDAKPHKCLLCEKIQYMPHAIRNHYEYFHGISIPAPSKIPTSLEELQKFDMKLSESSL